LRATFSRPRSTRASRAQEARHLRGLLEAADIPALASRSPITGPGADMYHYELAVSGEQGTHRVAVSGRAVPGELRPLIELLERRAQGRGEAAGPD
jgi:hypothetical protein